MKGPYAVIVASTKADAEFWARRHYAQTNPKAVVVGVSRDERKTYRVYDLDNEEVQP